MIQFEVRRYGSYRQDSLLVVGLAELREEGGREFVFQGNLEEREYEDGDGWPEGDSYCVSDESGRTSFACISEVEVRSNSVRFVFNEKGKLELLLDDVEYGLLVVDSEIDVDRVASELRQILQSGPSQYHPRLLGNFVLVHMGGGYCAGREGVFTMTVSVTGCSSARVLWQPPFARILWGVLCPRMLSSRSCRPAMRPFLTASAFPG
jgi:hypothetical protein